MNVIEIKKDIKKLVRFMDFHAYIVPYMTYIEAKNATLEAIEELEDNAFNLKHLEKYAGVLARRMLDYNYIEVMTSEEAEDLALEVFLNA